MNHFTNFPHSSGIIPRYQHGDFNTNSESYYKELARKNEELNNLHPLIDQLFKRGLEVSDTLTVDLEKIGNWSKELDPTKEPVEEIITLKANVLLSVLEDPIQLKSLSLKATDIRQLKNAITVKEDGLYSKDLFPIVKEIDDKLDLINQRLDELDPEGASVLVPVGASEINQEVPVPYKNLDTVLNEVDNTKFNVAFITDLHLYPASNYLKNKDNFRVLGQFEKLVNKADIAIHCGDNVDSYSGALGANNDVMLPEDVKRSTIANMKRFSNYTQMNLDKDVHIVIGNHDRGGIPYATNKNHDLSMVLSKAEMEAINGQPLYGGQLYPDKKIGFFKMYSDDFSEQQADGYFKETDNQDGYQNGLISAKQFRELANFMNSLPADYHLLVAGHIIIDKDKMGNGQILNQVFNAYQKGEDFTIPANTLVGLDNSSHSEIKFNNATKGVRAFIGYLAGHYHSETNYNKNTDREFNMACLLNAFPLEGGQGTELEGSFYNLEIDTTARTLKAKGVGRATNFINWTY